EQKDIIFSNIIPYFVTKGPIPKWGIMIFRNAEDQIFHALKGNFYRIWDSKIPNTVYTLPELCELAKSIGIDLKHISVKIYRCFKELTGLKIEENKNSEIVKKVENIVDESCILGKLREIGKYCLKN
ncbi:MAG: hypothetical protein ACE14V_15200, partial [bacterium]